MPETRVISLKGRLHDFGPRLERAPAGLLYVGRAQKRGASRGGWNLDASPFANPYPVGRFGYAGSLTRFRAHVGAHPELVARIREHAGGIFACWCGDDAGPDVCHAAIWALLADGGVLGARPFDFDRWIDFQGCADGMAAVRRCETVVPVGEWVGVL